MLVFSFLLGMCLAAPVQNDDKASFGTKLSNLPGFVSILPGAQEKSHGVRNARGTPPDAAFDSTCRYVTLGGYGKKGQTTLEATCKDDDGSWWKTTLNINDCIGNKAGELVYSDGGNFDDTCRPCTIDSVKAGGNVVLKCNCLPKPNAVPKYTALQIGTNVTDSLSIKPVNGRLVCGDHEGTKSPAF